MVDDSRTSRMMVAAAVRQASGVGASIQEASTFEEAVAAFERQPPDVVFLDMMLDLTRTGEPGGSTGLLALNTILLAKPDARVVLVTALPRDHPDVLEAVSLGAYAHLEKPLRSDAVRAVLQRIEAEQGRLGRIR